MRWVEEGKGEAVEVKECALLDACGHGLIKMDGCCVWDDGRRKWKKVLGVGGVGGEKVAEEEKSEMGRKGKVVVLRRC